MKNKKKIIGVVLIIAAVSGFFFAFPDIIPAVDDAKAPVHSYISGFYIENSIPQTGAHNIVTAVLADWGAVFRRERCLPSHIQLTESYPALTTVLASSPRKRLQ